MSESTFTLFPCCIPVRGAKKAVICDLQRNDIYRIPLTLYELLDNKPAAIDFDAVRGEYADDPESLKTVDEYARFLHGNELGVCGKAGEGMRSIGCDFYDNRDISVCMVDFGPDSAHDIHSIGGQLDELGSESPELRYFADCDSGQIRGHLSALENTSLRNVEIVRPWSGEDFAEEFHAMKAVNFRLTKCTFYRAPRNRVYRNNDYMIVLSREDISDESSCGCVSEFYCVANTQLFVEAHHCNTCLYGKISVDARGNIKNCPSMKESYGRLDGGTTFREVTDNPSFRKYWYITKDEVKVCRDCELRYVCQDCRAYLTDTEDIYSNPAKCSYAQYSV